MSNIKIKDINSNNKIKKLGYFMLYIIRSPLITKSKFVVVF
jgi:hypothetical protein